LECPQPSHTLLCCLPALCSSSVYGEDIGTIFHARAPPDARSAGMQAAFQTYATLTTAGIAVVGGAVTALAMLPLGHPPAEAYYSDRVILKDE